MTRGRWVAVGAFIFATVLGACGGSPPTDELTAAERALAGAEAARRCAPEEFRAAERLLNDAREANERGDYERALVLAESAREQAERARLMAQANAEDCVEEEREQLPVEQVGDLAEIDTDYDLVPVYFGFDSSQIDDRARQTLQAHARYLSSNAYRLTIEGHCDHNGTDQYNLVLGEARARAVAQYLATLGIAQNRLSTISYGEFRPASPTDSAQNRRAEFRLRQ